MATTVVIVDDDDGFRAAARVLLEAAGMLVVGEAGDGPSGLDLVHQLAPAVVLLDLRLPGRSGLDVAAQLEEERCGSKVVLMSSQRAPRRVWDPDGPVRGFVAKEDLSPEALAGVLAT